MAGDRLDPDTIRFLAGRLQAVAILWARMIEELELRELPEDLMEAIFDQVSGFERLRGLIVTEAAKYGFDPNKDYEN